MKNEAEILEANLDYLKILQALTELPFKSGKKRLMDLLRGKETQKITENRLYTLKSYNSLSLKESELSELIETLILNGLIKQVAIDTNRFMKLLEITPKGIEELNNPTLYKKQISHSFNEEETKITEHDLTIFNEFKEFLYSYNLEQKKAITSPKSKILCIAGAGSGKTSVLIKRIEFLIKYKSINPEKILAITFTRKAKNEMLNRLSKIPEAELVNIHTFNSFSEKILQKYNNQIYDKPTNILTYGDKITILNLALNKMNLSKQQALNIYFQNKQTFKTPEQQFNIFLNDCFFIRDYFKAKNKQIQESEFITTELKHKTSIRMIIELTNIIEAYMRKNGLRTFGDQLLDTIKFLTNNPQHIPEFDHILIDEYQDINSTQIQLLNLLNPENLFAVGDPRQSIYGWRGSNINYILNFQNQHNPAETITLTKNYRSKKQIIKLINESITHMGFKDLESDSTESSNIHLLDFKSEDEEHDFILNQLQKPNNKTTFILARTNNQLNELSKKLNQLEIKHLMKTDDNPANGNTNNGNGNRNGNNNNPLYSSISNQDLTLATIHSIKGLEADTVFLIGCTTQNFPCRGSEHPIIEMVKVEEYDKEEEERRLFYVAMSRAKTNLYLTYSKKPTYFIKDNMIKIIKNLPVSKNQTSTKKEETTQPLTNEDQNLNNKLKSWRKETATEQNLPAYCIINNKTIEEITINKPQDFHDLEKIHGIGEQKIEKYGSQILRIIEENE
jgi:superfamily I DNA/RNA helicase